MPLGILVRGGSGPVIGFIFASKARDTGLAGVSRASKKTIHPIELNELSAMDLPVLYSVTTACAAFGV